MLGWHLNFRVRDNRVIATTVAARRRVARSCLTIGERYGLVAFGFVERHGHSVVVCDRQAAGDAAQAILSSITQALGLPVGFAEAWYEPIGSQHKLREVFLYVLDQNARHGSLADPLRDATALPDLFGLRQLGTGLVPRVRRLLPEITREALVPLLGVDLREAFAPEHLADSAAAAVGKVSLRGQSCAQQDARLAVAHAAHGKLAPGAIAEILGCDASTLRRMRDRAPKADLVAAIRRGMGFRSALGDRLRVEQQIPESRRPRRRRREA
ncbi:MAG: hypothetical protein ACOZNI_24665 [Myxococcota bacterium]